MSKPPADADPEKFILGRGVYSNLQTATPYNDDREFRLDPTPLPTATIVIYNLIFVAFFLAFHLVAKHLTRDAPTPGLVYVAPIAIGTLTCTLFTIVTYRSFATARRLGPWLVYDKPTGRLTLPRDRLSFNRDEILHLQYITTKRLDWGGVANNERLTELNLIIRTPDGRRHRHPLLRSIAQNGFDRLAQSLLTHTDLPILRVQDDWLGWTITETPYTLPPHHT